MGSKGVGVTRPQTWQTQYGWSWLPADASTRIEATRMATLNGRSVTQVLVKTEDYERMHDIQIVVSPQGRSVQVFVDGVKMVKEDSE